jgi:putative SOS response-associated peptidase YedK
LKDLCARKTGCLSDEPASNNRDPVLLQILPENHHDAWLAGEARKEILIPFPADQMKASAINPRVNSPKNNNQTTLTLAE